MVLARIPYKIKQGLKAYTNLYMRRLRPVIVFTTGRVGSMALHGALEKHGIFAFHLHTLNPAELKNRKHPQSWLWAYNHIIQPRRPARIISIVRDPVALMVSDFFPKLRWIARQERAYEKLSAERLCDLFTTRYFEQERHLRQLDWFDREMKQCLGIDVFQHPFPKEDGYLRFQQALYDVLVFKTELDDTEKTRIVGDFLGLRQFEIFRSNVGAQKSYGDAYHTFKQLLAVPERRLTEVYSSRYARHFYTKQEIAEFSARWSGNR